MAPKLNLSQCYKKLGLKPGVQIEQLKLCYRELSKRWHPDQFVAGSDEHAQALEMQIEINEAYEQLFDEISANGPAQSQPNSTARRKDISGISKWSVEETPEVGPQLAKVEYANILQKAKHGDATAQYVIGLCIELGSSQQMADAASAAWWYERAITQDNLDAMVRLALLHLYGKGVKQDRDRAHKLLTRAAQKEHVEAMYQLGLFHSVILDDSAEATKWYQKCAAKGHIPARRMIDLMQ